MKRTERGLHEEGSGRCIAMTCHVDSDEAEKANLHFVEQEKPRRVAPEKIYVAHPQHANLALHRFEGLDRDVKNHAELATIAGDEK
jgi:hypothetical protein